MAYSVTAGDIRTKAKRLADMENSSFVSDSEWLDYVSSAYAELYDILTTKFERYNVSTSNISITSGTTLYNLPSDFYKLVGADFQSGSDYIPIQQFPFFNRFPTGNHTTGTVRIWYTPAPAIITSAATSLDVVSGWHDYIAVVAAIMAKEKEESSTTGLERRKADLTRRIEVAAENRDAGMPRTVTDIYLPRMNPELYLDAGNLKYQLVGSQIMFSSVY